MAGTSLVIDDKLMAECQEATGIKTKRALIHYALEELLRHSNRRGILGQEGHKNWEGSLAASRNARARGHSPRRTRTND